MKPAQSTKFVLLAVCSGALFFHFPVQPNDSSNTSEPFRVAAKTTAKKAAIIQVNVSIPQALKVFHDKHPHSSVSSLSLEKKAGRYRYEVEGLSDSKEYELKIDASSKKVYDTDTDRLDQVERQCVKRAEKKLNTKKLLSLKKAVTAAQKKVKSGTITKVSLDKSLGITYWEVEFQQTNKKVEVQLNAQTGKYLAKETSEVDDD